jgi:hypothetical protein
MRRMSQTEQPKRRFPPPWTVEEIAHASLTEDYRWEATNAFLSASNFLP